LQVREESANKKKSEKGWRNWEKGRVKKDCREGGIRLQLNRASASWTGVDEKEWDGTRAHNRNLENLGEDAAWCKVTKRNNAK